MLKKPTIISFMQLFTTDVYLDAFLSELKLIGLDYTVYERRPIRVASVADYHAEQLQPKDN